VIFSKPPREPRYVGKCLLPHVADKPYSATGQSLNKG
jgi:hypothetical protein